ncbi:helix-turn-helix domain-containing protein [Streptomyces silvensis]|uniref:HTH cro/C1-type domain-containing protein n=1 Tax=Streptomyces silvensis TaxID=1765722 RepID=A0A0W7X6D1_9ACTN|nr:helix-turn-helix transcriptional regulator [Streptomyces silvensis]KUF18408.1 hypothetical protein AT728_18845 [Streptomyces silvensis]
MYRLNTNKLRQKLKEHGNPTGHTIQTRAGVSQTTSYRILRGEAQPDLITAMRLSVTFDFDLRDVMDEVDEPTADKAIA